MSGKILWQVWRPIWLVNFLHLPVYRILILSSRKKSFFLFPEHCKSSQLIFFIRLAINQIWNPQSALAVFWPNLVYLLIYFSCSLPLTLFPRLKKFLSRSPDGPSWGFIQRCVAMWCGDVLPQNSPIMMWTSTWI